MDGNLTGNNLTPGDGLANTQAAQQPAQHSALPSAQASRARYPSPGAESRGAIPKPVAKSRQASANVPQVKVVGAFRSFATEHDEALFRDVLQAGRRAPRRPATGPRNNVLDLARCGVLVDGVRCGRRLPVVHWSDGVYRYFCAACQRARHLPNGAPGVIDRVIIDAVKAMLRPGAFAALLRDVRANGADATNRIAMLTRLHAHEKCEVARFTVLLKDASTSSALLRDHWNAQLVSALEKEKRVKATLESARRDHQRSSALAGEQIAQVIALADAGPALIDAVEESDRSGATTGALRSLLREFISAVYVREVGTSTFEVTVEFPTGATAVGIAMSQPVASTQPERVFAKLELDRGTPVAEITEQLNRTTRFLRRRPRWTEERTRAAALQHAYLETHPERERTRPLEAIARELELAVEEIWLLAMEGRLGPASIRAGALQLAPTDAECSAASSTYAIRWVAQANQWPVDDTVAVKELQRDYQFSYGHVCYYAARGSGLAFDPAGLAYVRRSEVADVLTRALESALAMAPAAIQALDPRFWQRFGVAKASLVATPEEIEARAVVLRHNKTNGGLRGSFVWVSPSLLEEFRQLHLTRALEAAGHPEIPLNELIALSDLPERFAHLGFTSTHFMYNAAYARRRELGTVMVKAFTIHEQRVLWSQSYLHVPRRIQEEKDSDVVWRYFFGGRPRTGPVRGRKYSPRE